MAATAPRLKKSIYSMHPSVAMEEACIANLQTTTGKTVEQWLAIIKKSGLATQSQRRDWLKTEHGLGNNLASYVAERAEGKGSFADTYDPDANVEGIFHGPKGAFRPIYETILSYGFKLGKDVKVCPCQTMIPFYRKHVFSQVKVPNRSRLDLGFALKDTPVKGHLIDTGGFAKKDRITHRIEIASLTDFDDEAKRWMKKAYEMDA